MCVPFVQVSSSSGSGGDSFGVMGFQVGAEENGSGDQVAVIGSNDAGVSDVGVVVLGGGGGEGDLLDGEVMVIDNMDGEVDSGFMESYVLFDGIVGFLF